MDKFTKLSNIVFSREHLACWICSWKWQTVSLHLFRKWWPGWPLHYLKWMEKLRFVSRFCPFGSNKAEFLLKALRNIWYIIHASRNMTDFPLTEHRLSENCVFQASLQIFGRNLKWECGCSDSRRAAKHNCRKYRLQYMRNINKHFFMLKPRKSVFEVLHV